MVGAAGTTPAPAPVTDQGEPAAGRDLVLEGVTKRFGSYSAVQDLDLVVPSGSFFALLGPSGCGKTTTLRMVAGLESPTAGRILIGGRDVTNVPPKNRDIAMVFQSYALYPHMTVAENMGFALKLRGVNKSEIATKVREAAGLLDLEKYLDRKPKALSGGQRQRVAMGRAIVRQPQVFCMDEPLSNLDAKLRVSTRTQIAALQQRLGVTTVYVTHDQVEAMTMGDRIAVMKDGLLQQCDTPMEIYSHPVNMFVAGFIGTPSMNFLPATLEKDGGDGYAINCGPFSVAAPAAQAGKLEAWVGKRVTFGVRPPDIFDKNLRNPIEAVPGNTVRTQVDVSEPMGDIVTLYLTAGTHQIVATIDAETRATDGQALDVAFDLDKTHLFDTETEQAIY